MCMCMRRFFGKVAGDLREGGLWVLGVVWFGGRAVCGWAVGMGNLLGFISRLWKKGAKMRGG